jgi:glucokinase
VDIGGSKFVTALVREDGAIVALEKNPWSESEAGNPLSAGGLVADLKSAIHALLAANPQHKPQVIGATIPGLANPEKGLWVEASFSGIKNLPFASIMEEEFRLPIRIDNDVRACALAERIWGCCSKPEVNLENYIEHETKFHAIEDFLWITVSNGIGGCVFLHGKPYRGAGGNAGEIGHIIVEEGPMARPCKAGHSGCAEMHASGRALALNYRCLGGNSTIDGEEPAAKSVAELARRGDRAALAAYELEGLYLGRIIGAAVNLLCPAKVIIGGGVSLDFDLFKPSLDKSLKAHMYENANPALTVEASPLGYNAALLGAAALAFYTPS